MDTDIHEKFATALFITIGVIWAIIAFNYAHYNDVQALSDNTTQQQ